MKELVGKVYNIFMWSYERGTWQYDVIVILILAFIFFTPRTFVDTQRIDRRILAYSQVPTGAPLNATEKRWISMDENGNDTSIVPPVGAGSTNAMPNPLNGERAVDKN